MDGFDPAAWQALSARLKGTRGCGTGLRTAGGDQRLRAVPDNGEIIAVVEAKRTSSDPRLAQAQAEFYVDQIARRQSFRPFAFMTNGHDIYFWDKGSGNKRQVAGFFSPDDLENLLYLRQNKIRPRSMPINTAITDRRTSTRRFAAWPRRSLGKRRALLVMATGTGKTRVRSR